MKKIIHYGMKNLFIISTLLFACACSHTVEEGVPDDPIPPTPHDTIGTPVDTIIRPGDIYIQKNAYADHLGTGQLVMVTDTLNKLGSYIIFIYFKKYNLAQQSVYGDKEYLRKNYFLDYYKKLGRELI